MHWVKLCGKLIFYKWGSGLKKKPSPFLSSLFISIFLGSGYKLGFSGSLNDDSLSAWEASVLLITIFGDMVILFSISAGSEEHGKNREDKQVEREIRSPLIGNI